MNKTLLMVGIIGAILLGSFFYFSGNNKTNQSSDKESNEESKINENPQYEHAHALFRNPDGTFLLGTHKGLFKSTDEGKTFSKIPVKGVSQELEFMNFAYDVKNKILYAGGHGLGIVKSTDYGTSWEKTDTGVEGNDIHALVINPNDSNRLYAYSVDYGVFGTKDGAQTWYRIDDGPANPSVTAFGYMATLTGMDRSMQKTETTPDIGYIWSGTGGGLYSSFLCFCGWTKNIVISSSNTIYSLVPDPVNKSSMLVGTSDGIYKTTDEGRNFTKVDSDIKKVASIAFDLSNPKSVYAITVDGSLYKSEDSGNSWNKLKVN